MILFYLVYAKFAFCEYCSMKMTPLEHIGPVCVRFYYHMYGIDIRILYSCQLMLKLTTLSLRELGNKAIDGNWQKSQWT